MREVGISCKCGKVNGAINLLSPRNFTHLKCRCRSCRAFARLSGHGQSHIDPDGFVDLVQTLPATMDIKQGLAELRTVVLTQKGPLRWYASCCDTPLWLTLGKPKPPFVSILAENIDDKEVLGPVRYYAFCDDLPKNERPQPNGAWGGMNLVGRVITRTLRAMITGKLKANPFFDESGRVLAKRSDMTKAQKAALFDQA